MSQHVNGPLVARRAPLHRPIDVARANLWASEFQKEVNEVATKVAGNTVVSGHLSNYTLYIESRFLPYVVASDYAARFVKPVEGRSDLSLYTGAGVLSLTGTTDPLLGYANNRPWYFARDRAPLDKCEPGTVIDSVRSMLAAEFMLYVSALGLRGHSDENPLRVYVDPSLRHDGTERFTFGELMPESVAGQELMVQYRVADMGLLRIMPCYRWGKGSGEAEEVQPKMVRREGEW